MNPSRLPFAFAFALLVASSVAAAGCAAGTSSTADDEEVGLSHEELSTRSKPFIGAYEWRAADSGAFADIERLELAANGTYSALVASSLVDPNVACFAAPCTLSESGKWSVSTSKGKLKIKLDPTGSKPARSYWATLDTKAHALSLTRNLVTTKLFAMPSAPSSCAAVLCPVNRTCVETAAGAKCVASATPAPAPCVKTGCSGQVCADSDRITTCEWRESYACYEQATCERQANGECGFTTTPTLAACLAKH